MDKNKIFSGIQFFSKNELSKIKNKNGFKCSECEHNSGFIYFEDSVKICPRKKIINLYNSSNIPSRFSKCRNTTLDNGSWEIRERSIQDALEYSVKYIKNFPNLLPPFFIGNPGLGKTHLSISIISELILVYGIRCLLKQFFNLIGTRSYYYKNIKTICVFIKLKHFEYHMTEFMKPNIIINAKLQGIKKAYTQL